MQTISTTSLVVWVLAIIAALAIALIAGDLALTKTFEARDKWHDMK